jgi:WD40 repeat protein
MEMKSIRAALVVVFALAATACGGGGDGAPSPAPPPPTQPPPPPSLSVTYPAQSAFTIGTGISAVTPTTVGNPTSFSVAPALPAGLSLSTTDGVISGVPSALRTTANYVVTASNASGSTTATIALTVIDHEPELGYSSHSYHFTTQSVVRLEPWSAGGAVETWSINNTLPAGLNFDRDTGIISGTPTQLAQPRDYVVTVQNSGGIVGFSFRMAVVREVVKDGVLTELGHAYDALEIVHAGTRIASLDGNQRVYLWDAQTGAILAKQARASCSMSCGSRIRLAGDTMVVRNNLGFTVRSAVDGSIVAHISAPLIRNGWWTLASDGSYIVAGDSAGLAAWSRDGTALFRRPGYYNVSMQTVSAAPGTLRINASVAGYQVIENIAVSTGISTSSAPFAGGFIAWFADGEKFLTSDSSVRVYTKDVAQIDVASPSGRVFGGNGDYFWTSGANNGDAVLRVYKVGTAGADATSFTFPAAAKVIPSGSTIGLIDETTIGVIDLAGATPSRADYDSPITNIRNYAAFSSNDWVFGNFDGLMLGELGGASPQKYGRGGVSSIAGGIRFAAVAFDDGTIDYFDAGTGARLGSIDMTTNKIQMSSDGTVLAAAMGAPDDRSMRFYSLPTGNLITQMPFPASGVTALLDFDFSKSGAKVAIFTGSGVQVRNLSGAVLATMPLASPDGGTIRFSPDDNRLAVAIGASLPEVVTSIYEGEALLGTARGWPVGWIDNDRLLLNHYSRTPRLFIVFDDVSLVSSTGAELARPPLPEMGSIQIVSGTSIYTPTYNEVLDLTTGNTLWSSAASERFFGAVVGTNVIFEDLDWATVRLERLEPL